MLLPRLKVTIHFSLSRLKVTRHVLLSRLKVTIHVFLPRLKVTIHVADNTPLWFLWTLSTMFAYLRKYKVHKLRQRYILYPLEDLPLMGFIYLAFTRMPCENYRGCTCGGVHVPCIYLHAR